MENTQALEKAVAQLDLVTVRELLPYFADKPRELQHALVDAISYALASDDPTEDSGWVVILDVLGRAATKAARLVKSNRALVKGE